LVIYLSSTFDEIERSDEGMSEAASSHASGDASGVIPGRIELGTGCGTGTDAAAGDSACFGSLIDAFFYLLCLRFAII
jgi:hypothetical protein